MTSKRTRKSLYVDEHNRVLPHSTLCGQTPDEMYFGTGDAVPADLIRHYNKKTRTGPVVYSRRVPSTSETLDAGVGRR